MKADGTEKKGVCRMDYLNAFWVGGLICVIVQILMEKTKLLPGRIMVLLVVTGCVISFFGLYEPLQDYAGAGASVPLLGYGNILMKGVKEAVEEKGFIGLFHCGLTDTAVRLRLHRSRGKLRKYMIERGFDHAE